MAILVRTCCCGCDLKTGVLLIGILGLLWCGYGVYQCFSLAKELTDLKDEALELEIEGKMPFDYKYYKDVINLVYVKGAASILGVLANIMLLASYCTRNRFLALPYVAFYIFSILFSVAVTIFLIAIWNGFQYHFAVDIISIVLAVYFILVVYSYSESLKEDPSGAIAGFGDSGTVMVQVAGPPPYAKFP